MPSGGIVSRNRGFYFRVESADKRTHAIRHPQLSDPCSGPTAPTHTNELRCGVFSATLVPRILPARSDSNIASLIVQAVMIDVINVHLRIDDAKYLPVH